MNSDKLFRYLFYPFPLVIIVLILVIVWTLISQSLPALNRFGPSLAFTSAWKPDVDPSREVYGLAFAIVGTLVTTSLALLLASALSISLAVLTVELVPKKLYDIVKGLTDLMASLPTVLYGLWALFVLTPFLKAEIMDRLAALHPLLGTPIGVGRSVFAASILLAIMITPFASAVIREGLAQVPYYLKEAVYALGATRWEATWIILKQVRRFIFGGLFIALGRAMGETIAVAMVVGNVPNMAFYRIFEPSYTISSLIADQFPNAEAYYFMPSTLYASGLILFLLGLLINVTAFKVLRGR